MSHALEQATDRYPELNITFADIAWARGQIREQTIFAYLDRPQDSGSDLWMVRVRGRWVGFVTNERGHICTAVPEHVVENIRPTLDARDRQIVRLGIVDPLELKASG